jgi:hypothetical protein
MKKSWFVDEITTIFYGEEVCDIRDSPIVVIPMDKHLLNNEWDGKI